MQRVFAELRLTKAELIRQSGISAKTIDRYLAGEPIVRRDKERALCAAVNWTPDSIERILAGGEPVEASAEKAADSSYDERLDRLERELAALRAELGLPRRPNGETQSA